MLCCCWLLVRNLVVMDCQEFEEDARRLFLADYASQLRKNGILLPTKNRDPIYPPWLNLEYEAMEQDRAKYFLYYTAIHMAMKSWNSTDPKHVMVVGAGRGRLVDFCYECLNEFHIPGTVHVIEVNPTANAILKEKFKNKPSIKVYEPLVIRTVDEILEGINKHSCDSQIGELVAEKCIDLFVSELFGSFGDNEFVGEILSTCVELFSKQNSDHSPACISIPESYTTYICAIHSQKLDTYFTDDCDEQLHVLGLPRDTVFLTDVTEVYTQSCTTRKDNSTHCVKLKLQSRNKRLTGLAGYFKAKLFGGLYIDTRPTIKQNTYFWESAFFPLSGVLSDCENNEVTITVSRKCAPVKSKHILNVNYPQFKLWYEWGKMSPTDTDAKVNNIDGTQHILYL